MDKKLPRAGGKGLMWIKPETYEALREAAARPEIVLDPTQFAYTERGGKKHYRFLGAAGDKGDGRGGGGGRFVPRIGGEGGTTLYVGLGAVSYCRIAETDPTASTREHSVRVVPIFPRIDGTPIDAEEPPGFDITGRAGASLWLKTDRSRGPGATFVPTEDSTETEELVILNRGQVPARKDGEIHTLLYEMDFETGESGAMSIANPKPRHQSDVQVWFLCEDDDSSESVPSDVDSSDLNSSDESDPDGSSESTSDDCPWAAKAVWYDKKACYNRNVPVNILWKVGVGIKSMKAKCFKWEVRVSFPGGVPVPFQGQKADGGEVVQPLNSVRLIFGAQFRFKDGPPSCAPTALTVRLVGIPDPELTGDVDECCKTHTKRFPETWPRWCGYTCKTTVVP